MLGGIYFCGRLFGGRITSVRVRNNGVGTVNIVRNRNHSVDNVITLPKFISVRVRNTTNNSTSSTSRTKLRGVNGCLTGRNMASFYPASVALNERALYSVMDAIGGCGNERGNTGITNVGLRNPFVTVDGGNTRGPRFIHPNATRRFSKLFSGDNKLIGLVAVTPRTFSDTRFVGRTSGGYSISVNRSTTGTTRTRTTFSLNTGRTARLCGTVAPVRRHRTKVTNATLSGRGICYRLVYSNNRVYPTILEGAFGVLNGGETYIVSSSVHTTKLNTNRCRLNNRPIFIRRNNGCTILRSNAVTTSVDGIFSRFGGLLSFKVSFRATLHDYAVGPTGSVNLNSRVNSVTINGTTSLIFINSGFRVGRICVGKALTWYNFSETKGPTGRKRCYTRLHHRKHRTSPYKTGKLSGRQGTYSPHET